MTGSLAPEISKTRLDPYFVFFESNELVSARPLTHFPGTAERVAYDLGSYVITKDSESKIIAKEMGVSLKTSHDNIKLRVLTLQLVDRFEVKLGSLQRKDHIIWDENFIPIKINDLFLNLAINSIEALNIQQEQVTLNFGNKHQITGTLVGDCDQEYPERCPMALEVETIEEESKTLLPAQSKLINIYWVKEN